MTTRSWQAMVGAMLLTAACDADPLPAEKAPDRGAVSQPYTVSGGEGPAGMSGEELDANSVTVGVAEHPASADKVD